MYNETGNIFINVNEIMRREEIMLDELDHKRRQVGMNIDSITQSLQKDLEKFFYNSTLHKSYGILEKQPDYSSGIDFNDNSIGKLVKDLKEAIIKPNTIKMDNNVAIVTNVGINNFRMIENILLSGGAYWDGYTYNEVMDILDYIAKIEDINNVKKSIIITLSNSNKMMQLHQYSDELIKKMKLSNYIQVSHSQFLNTVMTIKSKLDCLKLYQRYNKGEINLSPLLTLRHNNTLANKEVAEKIQSKSYLDDFSISDIYNQTLETSLVKLSRKLNIRKSGNEICLKENIKVISKS